MAKKKPTATASNLQDQVDDLAARLSKAENEIVNVQGKATKDVAAVHRSLKDYKMANDHLVAELRRRIEGVAHAVPRRRG